MKKKILGAVVASLCIAVCFSLGMTIAKADNGNGPTPRVCSHPFCWSV